LFCQDFAEGLGYLRNDLTEGLGGGYLHEITGLFGNRPKRKG
jgi:hypothetical protein